MAADDTSTPHSAAPGPASGPGSSRFFGWMRGLGIVRGNGWIGGVCGGVAARLGIDPLIVRGIVVVIAVLGGPAFLLYAAAWLLLPDAQDEIHLERMISGHLEPAIIGIAVLVLFSLLPFAQGFWWAGAQFWGDGSVFAAVGRTMWTLLVIAVIVAVVIWAARTGRMSSRGDGPSSRTASASAAAPGTPSDTDAPSPTGHQTSWFSGTPAPGYGTPSAVGEPTAPTPPTASATADELSDWRARQDAWKVEHAQWRAGQQADERAVRQQRSAEIRAQSMAMSAQAAEARRQRRLANPRTSAGYVGVALGVGLLAGGAGAAIALSTPDVSDYAVTIGLASATLVTGLAIVLAGALRRRSGFLSFVAILLVAASVLTALPPRGRDFTLLYASYGNPAAVRSYQPIGSTNISLDDTARVGTPIDVQQWVGSINVFVSGDITVRVIVTQADGRSSVTANTDDADGKTTSVTPTRERLAHGAIRSIVTLGNAATPDVTVRVEQSVGSVSVERYATASPTPGPTATTPSTK